VHRGPQQAARHPCPPPPEDELGDPEDLLSDDDDVERSSAAEVKEWVTSYETTSVA
jgi:hypothetical protein